MNIVIHGGGYVGLTAAVHYARAGVNVTIFDPDEVIVAGINSGNPRAGDFLSYLDKDVKALVGYGTLRATSDFAVVKDMTVHSVAVPTEKEGEPFDDIVSGVVLRLIHNTPKSTTIIIESTLSPGTTDAILRLTEKTAGDDFYLAVCPRRDWFADTTKNLNTLTRVVGGVSVDCTWAAVKVLEMVTPSNLIQITDYATAELTKALENALLHVQVMFAHQLALSRPDLDVAKAVELAGSHWRIPQLHLGFGTGGRCVPLGTKYLVKASKGRVPLVMGDEALLIDDALRKLIAYYIFDKFPNGNILVMGMGYRPDFKDMGLSPGLAIAKHLQMAKARVRVVDHLWSEEELHRITGIKPTQLDTSADAILLATPHTAFLKLPENPGLWRPKQFVLDASGAWSKYQHTFDTYGVTYVQVGRPGWINYDKIYAPAPRI